MDRKSLFRLYIRIFHTVPLPHLKLTGGIENTLCPHSGLRQVRKLPMIFQIEELLLFSRKQQQILSHAVDNIIFGISVSDYPIIIIETIFLE